ncbi:MAG: hypothetical protein KC549_00855, partial [Myxococcales bacterium]|nr:hypothetical protein [Myxococcales bacterium]
ACACSNGRCVGDLMCRDGAICVEGEGFVGGTCLADGSCLEGGRCQGGLCAACNLGTDGCACRNGGCFDGLACQAGLCGAAPIVQLPPVNPRCYTPCQTSFEDAGGIWRRCDSEGLMEGCLDDKQCDEGACLAAGEARRACATDYECPDFTRCIAGACYSECDNDGACAAGTECIRKVCRTPCRNDDADAGCPPGEYCASNDGTVGHCQSLVPPAEGGEESVPAALVISETALRFNASKTEGRFLVRNTAPTRETLVIRKLSHEVFSDDGRRTTLTDEDDDEACDPVRTCPLPWMELSVLGQEPARVQRLEVTLAPGAEATVVVSGADGIDATRWQGVLELVHPTLNRGRLSLEYAESPAGQWTGTVYYFASFGTHSVDMWAALPNPAPGAPAAQWQGTKDDASIQQQIGNAFLQRWGAFRRGRINLTELQAVLTATRTESWRWPAVQRDCPTAACYLYDSNRLGLREYSSDLDSVPVPSGLVDLPIGLNIYQPDPDGDAAAMVGRIDSATAMHYAGNPEISLRFDGDPTACSRTIGGACLVYLEDLSADVAVGGRYATTAADAGCQDYRDGSYTQVRTPWLLTDFMRNTTVDPASGNRYRYQCRDTSLPFRQGIDPEAEALANLSLVGANPIPDGRARRRHIELVDGALINQTLLLVIFKERFESFLDPVGDTDGFEAYGFMLLTRENHGDDETDADGNDVPDIYQGSVVQDARVEPTDLLAVSCDAELVDDLLGGGGNLTAARAGRLVNAVIEGMGTPAQAIYLAAGDREQAHYLCYDEGTIDGECPAESRVLYFTVDGTVWTQARIDALACQERGTCLETVLDWRDRGGILLQYEAPWRCANPDEALCSANRFDLREGKRFFAAREDTVVSLPIRAQIDEAFRYKTRFRNREGRNLGFAPSECLPDSNQIPYCYDPAAIEDIRARIDCLLHIQDAWHDRLSAADQATLDTFMRETFAYRTEPNEVGQPVIYDGFERSYAELLVMLGDEAYTRSFASRFDLAGQNAAAFEGSLFEEGGLDLSGQVGYEMYTLHQAVQYYDEVLDRFYALSPQVWRSLQAGGGNDNFITPETVTRYLDRLVRASSQKSRTWAQIADRYRAFNRPDLARPVIERAYTGAYLESIVMSRMMLRIIDELAPESRPQIEAILLETQRRYRIALNDMREAYGNISDQQTFYGIPPDYVPIPALDSEDFHQSNAFEVLLRRTRAKLEVAAAREQQAIESNRSFDTDAAQFQAELVRIRNTYEDQLAAICGTFTGDDGVVYPATARYADRSDFTAALGDPCGLTGNGDLFQEYGQFEVMKIDMQKVVVQIENTLASAEIERQRASEQCGLVFRMAEYTYEAEGDIRDLETAISAARFVISRADRTMQAVSTYAQLTKCDPVGDCTTAGIASGLFAVAQVGIEIAAAGSEVAIGLAEREISQIRRETARWNTERECDQILIDSNARMSDTLLRLKELELEYLRAEYQVRLQVSEVQKLRERSTRLAQQQEEAQQLQINAEAARNDPNVRIYRNDAIINADFSFEDAMAEAYRLTRVFEYYTSQTFAGQDRLYFVRLIQRGDENLENYVTDLENAFFDFEEEFGIPDTRVLQVSLMNDILAIPRLDDDGNPLSDAERTTRLRAAMRDPTYLDA